MQHVLFTSHNLFLWISLLYINIIFKSQNGLAADRRGSSFSEEAKRTHGLGGKVRKCLGATRYSECIFPKI